jgi:hypothetical protein
MQITDSTEQQNIFRRGQYIRFIIKGTALDANHNILYVLPDPANKTCLCSTPSVIGEQWTFARQTGKSELITDIKWIDLSFSTSVCFKSSSTDTGKCVKRIPPYHFHHNIIPVATLYCLVFTALCLTLQSSSGSPTIAVGSTVLTYLWVGLADYLPLGLCLGLLVICMIFILIAKNTPSETALYVMTILFGVVFLVNLNTHFLDPYSPKLMSFAHSCFTDVKTLAYWSGIPCIMACVLSIRCEKLPINNVIGISVVALISVFEWNDSWHYAAIVSICTLLLLLFSLVYCHYFQRTVPPPQTDDLPPNIDVSVPTPILQSPSQLLTRSESPTEQVDNDEVIIDYHHPMEMRKFRSPPDYFSPTTFTPPIGRHFELRGSTPSIGSLSPVRSSRSPVPRVIKFEDSEQTYNSPSVSPAASSAVGIVVNRMSTSPVRSTRKRSANNIKTQQRKSPRDVMIDDVVLSSPAEDEPEMTQMQTRFESNHKSLLQVKNASASSSSSRSTTARSSTLKRKAETPSSRSKRKRER